MESKQMHPKELFCIMQEKAFEYRLSSLNPNDHDFVRKLSDVIWKIAEPDTDKIKKYLHDLPPDQLYKIDNFRFLSVIPEYNGDTFKLRRKTRIVFRTEKLATGETAAVNLITPPPEDYDYKKSKEFKNNNPIDRPIDLSDPVIIGGTKEILAFREDTPSPKHPIQELSLCHKLFDGIAIHNLTEAPVWVYRNMATLLASKLLPVETLNIWVKKTANLDPENTIEEIKKEFSQQCAVLEIAFYDEEPKDAEWYNQLTLEESDS